ncbi:MAG: ABC transporter ATP-binding protein [Dehalococcoidia bacterium]|nr:ABC transporter ATP-binding protein [Dehalococcoidia bacterium]
MEERLVEAREISKAYNGKVRALDRVSFHVDRGEWVAIMGPSGSGKTSLLNLLGCLDHPTSGALSIDGTDVAGLSRKELTRFRRETVGFVFQQFYLIPYLTALENVMLAQYFHSIADQEEARTALEAVGLVDRLHHLPSQLSGGEQQRVCIARALINEPKILLADEPTGNLDKANEDTVMSLFKARHAEGYTIIMVTHDPDIGAMADRVIRLAHGHMQDEPAPAFLAR